MPSPPVSQYKNTNRPTAFQVNTNGAASAPAWMIVNQPTVNQSTPPCQGSVGCSGLSARFFVASGATPEKATCGASVADSTSGPATAEVGSITSLVSGNVVLGTDIVRGFLVLSSKRKYAPTSLIVWAPIFD